MPLALPGEYVIDFGLNRVPIEYVARIKLVARDGTSRRLPIEVGKGADPKGCQEFLLFVLPDNGWVGRAGPGTSVIITGTQKGSPVMLVTVKSDVAVPAVYWRPVAPKKKEP